MNKDEQILLDRAHELAQPEAKVFDESEALSVVQFSILRENFGFETRYVAEVSRIRDFTPIASSESYFRGVLNLHGKVIPLIDIKPFFGLPEQALSEFNRVVVIAGNNQRVGILIDALIGSTIVMRNELQSSISTLSGMRARTLLGITPDRVTILNADKLLLEKDIFKFSKGKANHER